MTAAAADILYYYVFYTAAAIAPVTILFYVIKMYTSIHEFKYKMYIVYIIYNIYIQRERLYGQMTLQRLRVYNNNNNHNVYYYIILFIECIRHKSRSRFTGIARDRRAAIYNMPIYFHVEKTEKSVRTTTATRVLRRHSKNGHGHRRPDPPQRYLDQGCAARARVRLL